MRVLIATDGSGCSYEAARRFIAISHGAKHEVTVLNVLPIPAVGRHAYLQVEQEREGLQALSTVKSIFDEVGIGVHTELRQGVPVDTILQMAREGDYELIVLGIKGKGGFREYVLGSVSKAIVQQASCSVLVVK